MVFQTLVNDVLREFLNVFVFVHIDDISIFSPDVETHVVHAHQVLQRLLENQLYVKAEKLNRVVGAVVLANSIDVKPANGVSPAPSWLST